MVVDFKSESAASRRSRIRPEAFGNPRGALTLPICAASNKQSGGITGKILSTRLDGISDITIKPTRLQQSSQKTSGDISRNAERSLQFREERSTNAIASSSRLHGANLCSKCGK